MKKSATRKSIRNLNTKVSERFWSKINIGQEGECWEWSAYKKPNGYGTFMIAEGRLGYAHRVAYQLEVGEIPNGLELDHLCRNRACVNPLHMEPVTHKENMHRGFDFSGINARKTHCPRGHEYTHWSSGARRCRICNTERKRESREQRRLGRL